MSLSGATRVAAVIGHPIDHTLSPAIHNAAFAACGLDWVFVAFDVRPGAGSAAVEAGRALGLAGMSVTMPHKSDVAAAVDRLSPAAAALGAVNCVVFGPAEVVGENTDGAGFLAALRSDHGVDPKGQRCVVIGAGGAARAVVRALAEAGAGEVGVVNRSGDRAETAAALAGEAGRVTTPDAIAQADLVVNATPVGMGSDRSLPLDRGLLRAGQVVVDLVYRPLSTPLLEAAGAQGCVTVDGLGMLVHQAAEAFRHWTGRPAPVAAMAEAARRYI